MSPSEPTRDQLLAMAYVDGELDDSGRAEFERRMADEASLRRQVSELRELELLARAAAPKEPMDHEWDALSRDPVQRGTLGLGWGLFALAAAGLCGFGLIQLFQSEEPRSLKVCLCGLFLGLALLFGAVLRARLRTLPLDPYRKVQR